MQGHPETKPRVLVMGCGGLGGIITARLTEAGTDVMAVAHNEAITQAVRNRGLILGGEETPRSVRARVFTTPPADAGLFDIVLLATQPPDAVAAARAALPHLAPDGLVVCLQNGLCEQHVAPVVGEARTCGAVVAWGASMIEAGVYERTSKGGFTIGTLDGREDTRLHLLAQILEPVGPVRITRNLIGARWSKLAINCAISSLGTIGGDRVGPLIRHRFVRRLALEVMTEAVLVARARGVRLEKVAGTIDLEWVALGPGDLDGPGSPSLLARHAVLLAVGARFRRLRSSMLAAIERGKMPPVAFINGEVVRHGSEAGVATPLNARVCDTVLAVWRGEVRPSLHLLRALYAESRSEVERNLREQLAPSPRRQAGGV